MVDLIIFCSLISELARIDLQCQDKKQTWRWLPLLSVQSFLLTTTRVWCNLRLWQQRPNQCGWKAQVWAGVSSARLLPWVQPLTSSWGVLVAASSVVRPLGLWVWSFLSLLSLWRNSLSENSVGLGKLAPVSETDLIALGRGWSWGKTVLLTSNMSDMSTHSFSTYILGFLSLGVSASPAQSAHEVSGWLRSRCVSHSGLGATPASGIIKICSLVGHPPVPGDSLWQLVELLFITALPTHTVTLTPTSHFTGGLTFGANNTFFPPTVALLSFVFFF